MSRRRIFLFLTFVSILLLDITTKWATVANLPQMNTPYYPYGGIAVFSNFLGVELSLVHAINKGAAWGMFARFQHLLIVLRIVLIAGTFLYLLCFNKHKNWEFPFAFILAGAVGNVIDYFAYGHVIDMFHFVFWGYDYPVFNIADSAIFIGIAWLILASFFEKKSPQFHDKSGNPLSSYP